MERKILLLDAAIQPVDIVGWEKGIMLLFEGKAEVLEVYSGVPIRSVKFSIEMPSVMRLFRCNTKRKFVKFSRLNIFYRDNYTCQYCRKKFDKDDLTLDHILPKCRRTPASYKSWTNIVTACYRCNQRKAGRTPEESGMRLMREPFKLQWNPSMVVPDNYPEQWEPYLEWLL